MKFCSPRSKEKVSSLLLLYALNLIAFGCSSLLQNKQQRNNTTDQVVKSPSRYTPNEKLVTGILVKTVEFKGWILKSGSKDYLLLSTFSYQKEHWFKEGNQVEVRGQEVEKTVTFHMQGTVFRVFSMKPLEQLGKRQR